MLEKLTDAQTAAMAVKREEWLKIGLSTEPLDFDRAKEAVIGLYKAVNLDPPKLFFRFSSPLQAAIGALALEQMSETGDKDPKGVSKSAVLDKVSDQIYGCHEAAWLSFYDFFGDVCGLDYGDQADALKYLIEIAKSCGWWAPYKNMAILQDRPQAIKLDDQNRLHCEDGAAIEYRDGFSVFAWRGVVIPQDWVGKNSILTSEMALKVENLEQRRVACEILGWVRILDELHAVTIDTDVDPQVGKLVRVNLPDIGEENFLIVRCGTGRDFAIPVPAEMKTALEANAWTYNLKPEEYLPEVRT